MCLHVLHECNFSKTSLHYKAVIRGNALHPQKVKTTHENKTNKNDHQVTGLAFRILWITVSATTSSCGIAVDFCQNQLVSSNKTAF